MKAQEAHNQAVSGASIKPFNLALALEIRT